MEYNYCRIHAENATVYLGKGAGNHVKKQIENAPHSIKVMSPYLSPELINLLIQKASQGVNVLLITSDDHSSRFDRTGQGRVIQQLVTQYRFTNEAAVSDKKEKIRLNYFLMVVAILIIITALVFVPNVKAKIAGIAIGLCLALIFSSQANAAKKLPIFYYTYSTKLNFKIIKQDRFFHDFFHLKAYVIDGETAYLGSLNFTYAGLNRMWNLV